MERNRIVSPGNPKHAPLMNPIVDPRRNKEAQECPLLFLAKYVIFVIVAVFILILPLGDPNEYCTHVNPKDNCGALCNLCELHNIIQKISRRIVYLVDILGCAIMDGLYEAKLKFYGVLEKLDRNDLCRSVCCAGGPDDEPGDSKEKRRAPCRCVKRKCRK